MVHFLGTLPSYFLAKKTILKAKNTRCEVILVSLNVGYEKTLFRFKCKPN